MEHFREFAELGDGCYDAELVPGPRADNLAGWPGWF